MILQIWAQKALALKVIPPIHLIFTFRLEIHETFQSLTLLLILQGSKVRRFKWDLKKIKLILFYCVYRQRSTVDQLWTLIYTYVIFNSLFWGIDSGFQAYLTYHVNSIGIATALLMSRKKIEINKNSRLKKDGGIRMKSRRFGHEHFPRFSVQKF